MSFIYTLCHVRCYCDAVFDLSVVYLAYSEYVFLLCLLWGLPLKESHTVFLYYLNISIHTMPIFYSSYY